MAEILATWLNDEVGLSRVSSFPSTSDPVSPPIES